MRQHCDSTSVILAKGQTRYITSDRACSLSGQRTWILALASLLLIVHIATGAQSQDSVSLRDVPEGLLAEQGMCYSPYRDGEDPGAHRPPTIEEICADLRQLSAMTRHIRIYDVRDVMGEAAREAAGLGLSVMAGAWLGSMKNEGAQNEEGLQAVIDVANGGHAQTLVVGNETLLRGDLSVDELLGYLKRVRENVPAAVQITTAEPWSIWIQHPELCAAVDVVLVHIYPFWEGKSINEAGAYFREKFLAVKAIAGRKPVIVGETGWPSAGTPAQAGGLDRVMPGASQQERYLELIAHEAEVQGFRFYWFAAYDEEWKWDERITTGSAVQVRFPLDRNLSGKYPGSSWGLLTADGQLKLRLTGLFPSLPPSVSRKIRVIFDPRGLSALYDLGVDSGQRNHAWLTQIDGTLRMAYPADQGWGAVFVTVGSPSNPPRPWKDFSTFGTLSVELRGELGTESVAVGIKDDSDPDDGTESKMRIPRVGHDWSVYRFPLREFTTADRRRLYVPAEFVFEGNSPATVYLRRIQYEP